MTLSRTGDLAADRETAAVMTEEQFLLLYHRTARPLRAYLLRSCRNVALADDLLQEAYLRVLRAELPGEMPEDHQRNYLYRTATNLMRDHFRRPGSEPIEDARETASNASEPDGIDRMLELLEPREREMLWLAHVERFSHEELGRTFGVKPQSVKTMLYRTRQKFADILRRKGWIPKTD